LAVRHGEISPAEFEAKVKKVLLAKYWAGLNEPKPVSTVNLAADLNRASAKQLVQQLSDAAVTQLKGDAPGLQLNPLQKTAIISVGVDRNTLFQAELSRWYTNNTTFIVNKNTPIADLNRILETLKQYDQVYVSIHDTRTRPQSKLDYSAGVKQFIAAVADRPNTVTAVFANPYSIAGLPGIEKSMGLLVCYQMSDELQRSAVKAITGQLKPIGKLPVSINVYFSTGAGASL
jgi:beta-N-acetylhexosaminidase